MRTYILPYNLGSASAKALAQKLGVLRVDGRKSFRRGTTIVNWGKNAISLRSRFPIRIINKQEAISIASNKLSTFRQLKQFGVPCVEWTTDRSVASGWLSDVETIVYARHELSACSGRGIQIVKHGESMPYAPVYTKGFNKTHEYRVHVVNGKVIDFTKKRRRDGGESNPLIKNFSNGWVFCREGIPLPLPVKMAGLAAVHAIGLDFGAIDILYKESTGEARVLEVNTAPGLEGTTLEKYTQAFREML